MRIAPRARLLVSLLAHRRHIEAIGEDLRAEIRRVAEGVAALGERLDRFGVNIREAIRQSTRELAEVIRFPLADPDGRTEGGERHADGCEEPSRRLDH